MIPARLAHAVKTTQTKGAPTNIRDAPKSRCETRVVQFALASFGDARATRCKSSLPNQSFLPRSMRWPSAVHVYTLRHPNAERIAHALKSAVLDHAASVMIGDREHDMLGAVHDRIYHAGVLWGYGSEEPSLGERPVQPSSVNKGERLWEAAQHR